MEENEEYDSDSTVLLIDYVDKPEKIDIKRRRLSNLHERGHESDKEDENTASSDDKSVNRGTGSPLEKKKHDADKNWYMNKYLESFNKSNDTYIQNNDSESQRILNSSKMQFPNDSEIKHGNFGNENSTNADNHDQIISLDTDDENDFDDLSSQDRVRQSIEISGRNDRVNRLHKPAPLTNRRATTEIVERNKTELISNMSQTLKERENPKIRILKPSSIINARRATINCDENNFKYNEMSRSITMPNDTNTISEKRSESDGCRRINLKLPKAAVLAAYLNNSLSNKGSGQDSNLFLSVNTHKRFGINSETETEPKRIKMSTMSTDAKAQLIKNTPSDVMSTTGAVNQKRESADSCDAKLKSTADEIKCNKTTPNKNKEMSSLKENEKLEASKINVNISSDEHKDTNGGSERSDEHDVNKAIYFNDTISVVNGSSTHIPATFNNFCENREMPKEMQDATSESCDNTKAQDTEIINKVQDKQIASEEVDKQKLNQVQDDQIATKALYVLEASSVHEQGISKLHDKRDTNIVQDDSGTIKPQDEARDKHELKKIQSEYNINETCNQHVTDESHVETISNQAQHKQVTKIFDDADVSKSSHKQEMNKVQDVQATSVLNSETITHEAQDNYKTSKLLASDEYDISNSLNKQKTVNNNNLVLVEETNDKEQVHDQLEMNNVQDEQIPNEADIETCESNSKEEISKVKQNDLCEFKDKQETQKINNRLKITESRNVQETVSENETTSKASGADGEDNDRVLTFQVGFFTLLKEYFKDIFPVTANLLHDLTQTLIADARNGQVPTDVKYSCPKCSRVSIYSSHTYKNKENEEDEANANTQKCGFCNGIRKIHNSYLKKFLGKKYNVNDKKEAVKIVSLRKEQVIQTEQNSENLTNGIVTIDSQTKSEAKTVNEAASLAAAVRGSSCSSIVHNEKQVSNLTLTGRNWEGNTLNEDVVKRQPDPKVTSSKKKSQLDMCSSIKNNLKKDPVNRKTSPEPSGKIKLVGKQVSDDDTAITKGNYIYVPPKSGKMYEEGSTKTDPALNNKRKNEETYNEKSENKRVKSDTEIDNAGSVNKISANVTKTNKKQHDILANQRNAKLSTKVQIIRIQNITSHRTERLNRKEESDYTEVNRANNSESCNKNTPEKESDDSTKKFKTNTPDRNIQKVCLKPNINSDNVIAAESEILDERNKQSIKATTSENIFDKTRQREVDENDRGKENASNKKPPDSAPESDDKQIKTTKQNDQDNLDVLKSLKDCYTKLKNSVKEKEGTPIKTQEINKKNPSESKSKIRSTKRGNRSNSLDTLPNRNDIKIVKKYVCPTCTSIYAHAPKLLQHMTKQHNPNLTKIPSNCDRLQCPFCRTLLTNKNYNKHVKLNHPEKFRESVVVVKKNENINNDMNVDHSSLERGNAASNEISESTRSIVRTINIEDVNNGEQNKIHDDENEELSLDEDYNHDSSIENEHHCPATTSIREIISVNHAERCCEESVKSSKLKSAKKQNTICNEEERARYSNDETVNVENNDSESVKSKPMKSKTSNESIHNRKYDKDQGNYDDYNEREPSNRPVPENYTSIPTHDATLAESCVVENGTHHNDELSLRNNNNNNSTENTENIQAIGSNIYKEIESDGEEESIRASDSTIKKRKERIAKLFGDENEASLPNKGNESNSDADERRERSFERKSSKQRERQIPKHRNAKTKRLRNNRNLAHRRRKNSVGQYTESSETSDSDWIISSEESSTSCDELFFSIKKQQVARTLFSNENETSTKNERNEESCFSEIKNKQNGSELLLKHKEANNPSTETKGNNDDRDDETIKSPKSAVQKRKEQRSETCVSDKISEKDNRQPSSEKNDHSDRQHAANEEGYKESVSSNCGQEVPSDDETVKVSEGMVKKRLERISKYFADDNVQNSDSNQQTENSDSHNADCRIPIVDDIRTFETEVVNVSEESVTLVDISNNENSAYFEFIHQATDRTDVTAVAEEENINAVNTENKSRDDDRIEINMIDRLLKEFDSDDHQASPEKEKVDDNRKCQASGESQATSESAVVKTCIGNIRITNVTSLEDKTNVFICQECNYSTDAYDDAIRHCQNHYNLIEDQVTYCDICQLYYDSICYERHQASHDKYMRNIKIKFSYKWLFTNWQMVFDNNDVSLSEAEYMQVKSIYKTLCVKMTVKEDGPWQSAVYLCAKCNTCVPPLDIEKHVQLKCTFVSHPCRACDRVFSTSELREHHEIYHTDDEAKQFKTIVFNYPKDDCINSKLINVKAHSKENQGAVDIFKCLCGLCFVSLKKLKLHFADCDSETNNGRFCPRCSGTRFSTTELEEHLLLHHSLVNYEFRLQKITFQQETIFDSSKEETQSEISNGTTNATQMTWNVEDENVKRDMLKHESLTQSTDIENRLESLDNVEEEDLNRDKRNEIVPETSDSTTNKAAPMWTNDEDLVIKREMIKYESLTQRTSEEKMLENFDNAEEADFNTDQINEIVPETRDSTTANTAPMWTNEDLIINREKLKDESLTQSTNEDNRLESLDNVEEEEFIRDQVNQIVPETSDNTTKNVAPMSTNDDEMIIKRNMLKDESRTQSTDEENRLEKDHDSDVEVIKRDQINEVVSDFFAAQKRSNDGHLKYTEINSHEVPHTDKKEDFGREVKEGTYQENNKIDEIERAVDTELIIIEQSDDPIDIEDSQENEVQESNRMEIVVSENLIIIEDSDEDDIEFVGESFPNTTKFFPLRYCSRR